MSDTHEEPTITHESHDDPEITVETTHYEAAPDTSEHSEPEADSVHTAEAAAAASTSYSSYSPPPPPAEKKSFLGRLWGAPGIILLLIFIIILLFIWGISAHQPSAKSTTAEPAQKVLHVTSAPSITAITQAAQPMTPEQTQLLMQARDAFWHHDYAGAIADYHHLIQEAPDSPSPYGELGNVLYMTGHYHQAAIAYGQAAMRLIHIGRYADGAALIPILSRLDPAEAQKVQIALSHAPEAETGMPPA
ncbi:MAG: tetratricopeptide repeat protein [Acidithiobacillus sp.]